MSERAYRDEMYDAYVDQQKSFDKTVVYLSGGGLGITFAFFRDIIGEGTPIFPFLLIAAWICWAVSVSCSLFSHLSGAKSCYQAILDHDAGNNSSGKLQKIQKLTRRLNWWAGVLFILGLATASAFVCLNL